MTTTPDPTRASGRWDRLFAVLRQIDLEIETLYDRAGHGVMRSRFAQPLLRLGHGGPSTIKELAASLDQSHSAMSQTVEAMKRAGLVSAHVGNDARTRVIELTAEGRALIPLVDREWRATEAMVAELDDTLTVSLEQTASELEQALAVRPARDRLQINFDNLAAR